jgi:hypothetical protein
MPLRPASALLVVLACAPARPEPSTTLSRERSDVAPVATPPPAPALAEPALEEIDAVVEIDAEPGGKRFQGVWLVQGADTRWVISYRAEPWLRGFEGQRVHARGRRYTPEGQAIDATHFRLEDMRVIDPSFGTVFIEVGPELTLQGTIRVDIGAAGTKSAGERWHVFDSETQGSFQLANAPDGLVLDRRIGVRARTMVYSPFVAHRGGPMLWVLDVDRDP